MIPEFPKFKALEISDRGEVEAITSKYLPYSDFNFVSMYSWDVKGEMAISKLNNNLVVRFTDYMSGQPFFSFLGDNMPNETAEILLNFTEKEYPEQGEPLLKLMPEDSVRGLDPEKFSVREDIDNFDYIFSVQDLCKYDGHKYQDLRNFLRRFLTRHPDYEIKFLTLEELNGDMLLLNKTWQENKAEKGDKESIENETKAIARVVNMDNQNTTAVSVFYQGTLIGCLIFEIIDKDNATCHFSKADIRYAGIYPFLMKTSCDLLFKKGISFLNYEQDLGKPELRYAKNSFKPVKFLKKYLVSKK